MNFRIRNIHTWMIIQKCKELGIKSRFLVPEKEDFLELKKGSKTIVINRAISPFLKHIPGAISEDKITCNHILQNNGFPVPPFIFSDKISNVESEFMEKNAPIVAKPYDTNKGAEIHMNIKTHFQLIQALESIRRVSNKAILQKQATVDTLKKYASGNSSHPDFLKQVVADARHYAPALSYGLVLWSHATSWAPPTRIATKSFNSDDFREMDIKGLM